MKVLVAIKRVPELKAALRLKSDHSALETAQLKMVINPFDELALEEALRLKEKGLVQEIVAVSIGLPITQENLRTALAMGADRGILVQTELAIEPLAAAKVLQAVAMREQPQLIILGKQAVDTDNNQTGQMLAGLLGWAQGTFISQLTLDKEKVEVTREIDGGLETLELKLPVVLTTDLRLNQARYISLPNIVKAKTKPIDLIPADSLGIDLNPRLKIVKMTIPEKHRAGVRVDSAVELLKRLKEEAKVLP